MYKLKKSHSRGVSLEFIGRIIKEGMDGKCKAAAINDVYTELKRKLPKNPTAAYGAMRNKLKKLIEANDPEAIEIAKKYALLDEEEVDPAQEEKVDTAYLTDSPRIKRGPFKK